MRRALASFVLVVGVLAALASPIPGDERFVRGVHRGRAYRLYLPAAVAPARPLVVALHGCAQTPEDLALGTRLNPAAARRGLAVLYPAQGALSNPARCWNWFDFSRGPAGGEIDEILDLIREIPRAHGLDGSRIVVVGFSAGGYMAVNIACAAPTLVVGIGVMAGGPYRCAENARGAVRCMRGEELHGTAAAVRCAAAGAGAPTARASLWHGDGDSVVSPANLAALTTMFARLHGSTGGAAETVQGAARTVYRAHDRVVTETWLVRGMGHAWSGGDPRGSHTFPPGPDATEAMLRFLIGA
jgi:poly(hydroxyalkanoate) depolymerase family esterase